MTVFLSRFRYFFRWIIILVPVAICIGSLVAFFLWLLHEVIEFRFQHEWLLYFLPLCGLLIHYIYQTIGKSSEGGNNLIIDEIHQSKGKVPLQMGPVVLFTTVLTHLVGGSAGREGTAVQIGGSVADFFGRRFRLKAEERGILLTAGVATGFGGVFGTPVAGAIFALEVLVIGRMDYRALLPALIASLIGDFTVSAWGIEHTGYEVAKIQLEPLTVLNGVSQFAMLLLKVVIASIAFGIAASLFSASVRFIGASTQKFISRNWMISVLGGVAIILLTWLVGKPDYLGLGVEAGYPDAVTIQSAFHSGGADAFSWLWKTVFTSVTLGTGFKGGEVTPLFYIGATLGNSLSELLSAPVSLFAALGFIAVFSGATNTPLTCTMMGVELFGAEYVLFFAVACFTAYLFSGHRGIYRSQRLHDRKFKL